jgi:hypothetical protein
MSTSNKKSDETRLAEEIVSVLPAESIVRVCSDDCDSVRFAIRAGGLRVRSVVLSRASLRRLLADPAGPTKVEYLKRDLLAGAERRSEFRYPRGSHGHSQRNVPIPVASAR